MATNFHTDPPVWADEYIWTQAEDYANRYADLARPPRLSPVISPGIQLAWNGLSVEERWLMLANMQAARLTEGAQFGQGGLGAVVVPIGEAVFNMLGTGSLSGAQANGALNSMLGGIGGSIKGGTELLGGITTTVNQAIQQTAQVASATHTQFMASATTSIADVLKRVSGAVDDTYSSVKGSATDAIEAVANTTDSLARSISAAVERALSSAVSTISKTVDSITTKIGSALGSAVDSLTSSISSVIDSVRGIVSKVGDTLVSVVSTIQDTVKGAVDAVSQTAKAIVNQVSAYIGDAIDGVKAVYEATVKSVTDTAESVVAGANKIYAGISSGIDGAITALTDAASGAITSVSKALDSLQGAVQTGIAGLADVGKSTWQFIHEDIDSWVGDKIASGVNSLLAGVNQLMQDIVTNVLRSFGVPDGQASKIGATFAKAFALNPVFGAIAALVVPIYIAMQVVSVPGQMVAQRLGQDMALDYPIALETSSDLQEMLRQGVTTVEHSLETLRKSGFSADAAQRVIDIRRRIPEIGIIQTWYLREFISADQATSLLSKLGFAAEDVHSLLQMSFFIPPVQDLITMAVREVFSPAIAEQFGQFQDFPPEFAALAKQQGVSEEWAKNYWAAHWSLPSLSMGYEMLHRRVIDKEELNVLLRAQDVMPYWRDKLVEISYNPLTRVDVRRMHKLGVLTDDEVYNSYLDNGYSPTNAARLRDFTILANKPTKTAVPADLTKLSGDMVIRLYSEGTIPRIAAADLLHKLGVGELAAQVYLEHADLVVHLAERKANTELVLEQAKAGILTYDQAQDRFAHLGLTSTETIKALTQLNKIRATQTQLPSRADLDKFIKNDLLTDAEYLATMQLNGYSLGWATKYLTLAKGA